MSDDLEQPVEGDQRVAEFAAWLRRLHVDAGAPSVRLASMQIRQKYGVAIAPSTLADWLGGRRKGIPPWDRLQYFASLLGGKGAVSKCKLQWDIARGVVPEPAGTAYRWIGDRLPRPGHFQPRPAEHAALVASRTLGRTAVVSGFPGTGKSHLVAAYANELCGSDETATQHRVSLVVWVPADDRVAIINEYALAAGHAGVGDPSDPAASARQFLDWLAITDVGWLVVLDNIEDGEKLAGLWPAPRPGTGQVIGTTVRADHMLFDGREKIKLGPFSEAQADAYLRERLLPGLDDDTAGIAQDLQCLPLALSHSAAYMNDRTLPCSAYRARFADKKRRLKDLFPRRSQLFDQPLRTVAVTMALSIDRANDAPPVGGAGVMLELACLLDPNGVPLGAFNTQPAHDYVTARKGPEAAESTEDLISDGLANLNRFSLASLDGDSLRVHALVQRAAQEVLLGEFALAGLAATSAAGMLLAIWPEIERDPVVVRQLRANAAALSSSAREEALWNPNGSAYRLLYRAAESLADDLRLPEAVVAATVLRDTATRHLGPDHPDTFLARSHLAEWSYSAGEFLELFYDQQATLGRDDVRTLTTLGHFILHRGMTGDSDFGALVAIPDTEALLAISVRLFGPDHRLTLTTRGHLADWYGLAGDPTGAAKTAAKLLDDYVRILGPDHPDTLETRDRLVRWRGYAGDKEGAVAASEVLIEDYLRIFGPHHRRTTAACGALVLLLGDDPDRCDAMPIFKKIDGLIRESGYPLRGLES